MSTLRRAAEDYLAMRRSLGYKLQRQGHLLLDFAGYLERAGATTVTIEAAVAWATLPASAAPVWHKHRLSVVRGFAAHYKTLDPSCQIPPPGLLPPAGERATPYLYSQEEIAALVHAAGTLTRPLLAATYQALISLLAVSGLRAGEAIGLTRDDVDLDTALITVINSKFGKSRLVPLHPATTGMLRRYAARRDQLCPAPATASFFISATGTTLLISSVDATFARRSGSPGSARRLAGHGHGSTTCAIRWPSRHCWTGTAPAPTFTPGCRCCPPGWATQIPPPRSGITPILGLFRCPLLRAREAPVAWHDALS